MSKYSIINLFDRLFVSIAVFLTLYAWINFYTRNLWISFTLSLVFSFACIYLINYFLSRKREKANLSKKQIQDINKNYLAFRILPKDKQLQFLLGLIRDKNAKIQNNMVIFIDNNLKKGIYIATDLPVLCENDFLNIVQFTSELNIDEIEIVCSAFNSFNTRVLKDKKYTLTNKENLYINYFEKHNIFPNTENIFEEINKVKFWILLNNFFMPQKAKSYFLCGLILIFSSIILPYHIYYVIFGSILLMFSVVCKLKKIISC